MLGALKTNKSTSSSKLMGLVQVANATSTRGCEQQGDSSKKVARWMSLAVIFDMRKSTAGRKRCSRGWLLGFVSWHWFLSLHLHVEISLLRQNNLLWNARAFYNARSGTHARMPAATGLSPSFDAILQHRWIITNTTLNATHHTQHPDGAKHGSYHTPHAT